MLWKSIELCGQHWSVLKYTGTLLRISWFPCVLSYPIKCIWLLCHLNPIFQLGFWNSKIWNCTLTFSHDFYQVFTGKKTILLFLWLCSLCVWPSLLGDGMFLEVCLEHANKFRWNCERQSSDFLSTDDMNSKYWNKKFRSLLNFLVCF